MIWRPRQKSGFSISVVAEVVVPHGCEYFPNGTDVFLYGSFLDGVIPCGKNSATDALVEDLEENYVVIHAFEVGGDIETTEEMPPLFPRGGVLPEDGVLETVWQSFVICHMHLDGRWSIHQEFSVGIVFLNERRKGDQVNGSARRLRPPSCCPCLLLG